MLIDILDKCINSVDNLPQALIYTVQDVAKRHVDYGTEESHYKSVGEALLWTIEQRLGKDWNDEVKDAWTAIYKVISDVMLETHRKIVALKSETKSEGGLTEKQKQLVKESWSKVVPIKEKAAKMFYDHLFEIAPSTKELFKNTNMKKQGKMLMDILDKAATSVDDLTPLIGAIQDLGKRHVEYGTLEAHYPVVGECLLWVLEQGLGKSWNDEVKEAWTVTYGIVAKVMIDAAKTVPPKISQENAND